MKATHKIACLCAVFSVMALPACTSDSADAQTQRAPGVSARDKAIGAEQHPLILAEFGGAYSGPGTAMVQRVGREMAVQSGISANGSDCTVTLLNSTVVNAFALPGCYVYVTRGLLAIMNDEAELASVLGHEIGHVAARHAQKRQTTSLLTGIFAALGSIATGSETIGRLLGTGAQLYTLRYSRSQEYQADDLGIRYMRAAGYDPMASSEILASLETQSQLESRMRGQTEAAQVPSWARTHPLTEKRVARAREQARAAIGTTQGLKRDRATYFSAVNGLLYDDDPAQGFVEGNRFMHPQLRLAFSTPRGYAITNGTRAVTITGPNGFQAQFTGRPIQSGEGLDSYISRVFQALLENNTQGAQFSDVRNNSVNGLTSANAIARVPTQSGSVDVDVVAYRFAPTTAYHFTFISPSGQNASATVSSIAGSMRRLSESEAAALRPRVIEVVTAGPGDTAASLAKRMAYSEFQLERLRTINDFGPNDQIRPGQQVKIVVYKR